MTKGTIIVVFLVILESCFLNFGLTNKTLSLFKLILYFILNVNSSKTIFKTQLGPVGSI